MGSFRTGKVVALMALWCLLCAGQAIAGVATEVPVNKSVLMNLQKPSERVSIANPAIAELVVISPTQLQINGSKIGTTSLIVWEKGGKTSFFDIQVKGDGLLLENQIHELAPNDKITVDYANDTIVLSGTAANELTIAKAVELAKAYAGKDNTNGGGSGGQGPGDSNGSLAATPDSKSKSRVINHIRIDNPHQILLEVKVAQVDKAALKSLGLSWFARGNSAEGFSNLVGAPSGELTIRDAAGNVISQATGIAATHPGLAQITPVDPFQLGVSLFKPGIGTVLRALATKNMAKILAEPNLLVKSGETGKFLAGTKYPITVVVGVGALASTEIRYEDVGVILNFKPEYLENGLISLKIDPAEVSSIAGFLEKNGYPIINTRELRTDVQLKSGESLVLGGLLQEETIKQMSKIPLLGDIPILGALFRSTQDDLKEKELMFFITPRLVVPRVPGDTPALPSGKLSPEQEKELRWMPLPD